MPKAFQIKITLRRSKPPIWRRVLVPEDITLDTLHEVIQICMGWTDTHLHQFVCGDTAYGVPDPEFPSGAKDEEGVRVKKFLKKEKSKIIYEYDFGDYWVHDVLLEKVTPCEKQQKIKCLKGVGGCPPEDCGGVYGYYHMLEVLSDPGHPEHDDIKEWIGDSVDMGSFDLDETNAVLDECVTS